MNETQQGPIARLAALNERKALALRRYHGETGVLTPASSTADQAHAASITQSAATMRHKGYSAEALAALGGRIAVITFKGPTPCAYMDEACDELVEYCPAYVSLADYCLACYEQHVE